MCHLLYGIWSYMVVTALLFTIRLVDRAGGSFPDKGWGRTENFVQPPTHTQTISRGALTLHSISNYTPAAMRERERKREGEREKPLLLDHLKHCNVEC